MGRDKSCIIIIVVVVNEAADEVRRAAKHGILSSNLTEEIFSRLFVDAVALVSHTVAGLQDQLNVLA